MHGIGRHGLRTLALAALAAAATLSLPGLAGAAWDGTQPIGLGDKIAAGFEAGEANPHVFVFYAPKGTVLDVKAKVAKGATLVPGFALYDGFGAAVDLGTTVSAAGVKKFAIPADGYFSLHVLRASGDGGYSLTTKGKFPTKLVVTGAADVSCGALAGAVVKASVKPAKGSAATATIAALTYPGNDVAITPGATISNVPMPVNNVYTFDLAFTGTGDVTTTISFKNPAFKASWSLGTMGLPRGVTAAIRAAWLASPHNQYGSEAFRHWDEDGEVSTGCAKCHSSGGYQDWVGADGSAFEVVDAAAALGTTVDCDACHNTGTAHLDTVLFPSGLRVDGLGAEARCMQCHQGRQSTAGVDAAIAALPAGTLDDDIVDVNADGKSDLTFKNVHYLVAAATQYGREAAVGYQYAGQVYDGKAPHVASYDSCIECHDMHSTALRVNECASCHPGVADVDDLKDVRMIRTTLDYDGDGNVTEGVAHELEGMANALYFVIKAYGTQISHPIAYGANNPYWFSDTNANGNADVGEPSYTFFTPRLLRAAYNYHYFHKDPGAYAHNPRYMMELLYDSFTDLNAGLTSPVALTLTRNEALGHFDATSMAFRDWDDDMMVNTSCAQCHSAAGFRTYIANLSSSNEVSQTPASPSSEGMTCESCHVDGVFDATGAAKLRRVGYVIFPSNRVTQTGAKKLTNGPAGSATDDPSFVCLTCHQGRVSKLAIDDYLLWNTTYSFQNVHYAAAGAMLYGGAAQVGYEYAGKSYAGKWVHVNDANTRCTYCHMQPDVNGKKGHAFLATPNTACAGCHGGNDPKVFRLNATADYDGDGNSTETLEEEVHTFAEALFAEIEATAAANGYPICYDDAAHPYWFNDPNANGVHDAGETSYDHWTATLVKAAHNYQFWHKKTAGWAHNRTYVLQLLYDAIDDLNGGAANDVPGLTRW
jgi:hypothetical protein